ncbi:MAG: hypothetical protein HY343_00925 [Lentisphaerae bacterium]|nr:hypothetical protein [Lentisphaerota bacterium]
MKADLYLLAAKTYMQKRVYRPALRGQRALEPIRKPHWSGFSDGLLIPSHLLQVAFPGDLPPQFTEASLWPDLLSRDGFGQMLEVVEVLVPTRCPLVGAKVAKINQEVLNPGLVQQFQELSEVSWKDTLGHKPPVD